MPRLSLSFQALTVFLVTSVACYAEVHEERIESHEKRMLRKNRQPRHGTEDATIVSLTNQVEQKENPQDGERLKIETITNINGNGIVARGIDLCNFIQRNGPEICPTPNGNNSCPLKQICEEGGLLTDFCASIAKDCSEDCVAAFSSCQNCGDADLDCSSMSQEMNLANSVQVGSKSHPFTGTTISPQRSDSTIMGSLTNVFDMDTSQKVDLCQLIKKSGTLTCPSPNGDNNCPSRPICESGGTLAIFCASRANTCQSDCVAAFSNCNGCIDDFDCSHAAADGVSEGGLCQAIQAAGTDTCPSPKGDNKCPKIQICKSGGTLEDFCKFKASACRESCVAAFANCDGCRSIKCKGKAASQSIKTTQAGSSPANPQNRISNKNTKATATTTKGRPQSQVKLHFGIHV